MTSVPILGPIPTTAFNLDSLQPPLEKGTELLLSIDLEGSGGRTCTANGTCAIGILGKVRNGPVILEYEVAIAPLGGKHDPEQVRTYWRKIDVIEEGHKAEITRVEQLMLTGEQPYDDEILNMEKLKKELKDAEANARAWERIVAAERPRQEVAAEIIAIMERLRSLGWKPHVVCRPAAYDFTQLTSFFETLGIDILEKSKSFGWLSQEKIINQARCGFPIDFASSVKHDRRNGSMVSPFGFGGQTQVTDIAQRMLGMAQALGVKPLHFNQVMEKVIGRSQLAHGGLQDAKDQLATWEAVLDHVDELAATAAAVARNPPSPENLTTSSLVQAHAQAHRKLIFLLCEV